MGGDPRNRFGQPIGKFRGFSFSSPNMAMEMKAAELMILEAELEIRSGKASDADMAIGQTKGHRKLGHGVAE